MEMHKLNMTCKNPNTIICVMKYKLFMWYLKVTSQNFTPKCEAQLWGIWIRVPKSHYGMLSLASRCMKLAFQISFQNIMLSHGQHSPKPRLEHRCTPKQHNVGMNKFMQHDSHFCDSYMRIITWIQKSCMFVDGVKIPSLLGYRNGFVLTQKVSIEKLTRLTPCNHITTNV